MRKIITSIVPTLDIHLYLIENITKSPFTIEVNDELFLIHSIAPLNRTYFNIILVLDKVARASFIVFKFHPHPLHAVLKQQEEDPQMFRPLLLNRACGVQVEMQRKPLYFRLNHLRMCVLAYHLLYLIYQ